MASTNTSPNPESTSNEIPKAESATENNWVERFEELLKVSSMDELRAELTKLATEIQKEIQSFDINAHLSPEAKTRLKTLEQRYGQIMRTIHKAQKQFDREFNKSLRVLKRTRQDAEKHLLGIKNKISKHQDKIWQASAKIKSKLKKNTKTPKKKSKQKGKRS